MASRGEVGLPLLSLLLVATVLALSPTVEASFFGSIGEKIKAEAERVKDSVVDKSKSSVDKLENWWDNTGVVKTYQDFRGLSAAVKKARTFVRDLTIAGESVKAGNVTLNKRQMQYVPRLEACRDDVSTSVRPQGQTLDAEKKWVRARDKLTQVAWEQYLDNVEPDIKGMDADWAAEKAAPPRLAVAVSGGSFRAMLAGAGVVDALDSRNKASVAAKTGGLLQTSTYMIGLSGGAWMTSSLWFNGGPPVQEWKDSLDLLPGLFEPGKDNEEQIANYKVFLQQCVNKTTTDGDFQSSLVDLWGRSVCYYTMAENDYCVNVTLSSLVNTTAFKNHGYPFPIELASIITNDTQRFTREGLSWEWNPLWSGVNSEAIDGFVQTQIVGSKYIDGKVYDKDECAYNVDNIGFTTGTSSAAMAIVQDAGNRTDSIEEIASVAVGVIDNPFKGMQVGGEKSHNKVVLLGDGALNPSGNIPIYPALLPERGVDVLIAVDASSDTSDNLPNGAGLVSSGKYARDNGMPFPEIPTQAYFDSHGELMQRVTFFGCDGASGPTIVYVPNHKVTYNSGTSTFKLGYSSDEVDKMVQNGAAMLTGGDTPRCLACLMLHKSSGRAPKSCSSCLKSYCWDASKL